MANFPNHPSSQVGHVPLRKKEFLLPSGQGLKKLTSEYTTVVTILLLRCVLGIMILPPCEVKWFLPLVSMFQIQIISQDLDGQRKDICNHVKAV